MLKPADLTLLKPQSPPAAFGRLCVETVILRLPKALLKHQPPSGGCVLKLALNTGIDAGYPAAFGRLCVETVTPTRGIAPMAQPPSGGCVLKQISTPPVR